MSTRRILEGPKAFHCPEHDLDMGLLRYGMEPEHNETYGVWKCPRGDMWFESEGADEWEKWEE